MALVRMVLIAAIAPAPYKTSRSTPPKQDIALFIYSSTIIVVCLAELYSIVLNVLTNTNTNLLDDSK